MFSVTLQQKQQKTNTTMYSKQKLSFIPKTFQSKQSTVLLSKHTLETHPYLQKEKQEKQCQ